MKSQANPYTILILILITLFISCSGTPSLQKFLVEQQERNDIISFDLSASLLEGNKQFTGAKDLETLKSLKKINVLAYKITTTGANTYVTDTQTIKSILQSKKYQELMRFGKGSQGAKVYLVGDSEAVDEIIVFAKDKQTGWLILRVLGNNMQPEKIIQLMQKLDFNSMDLGKLKDVFKK